VKPGDTHIVVPAMPRYADEGPCRHSNGWRFTQDDVDWYGMSLEEIPAEVKGVHCDLCGELWFRNEDGHENGPGWHQKYWTEEEIAEVKENAKKYDAMFDLEDTE